MYCEDMDTTIDVAKYIHSPVHKAVASRDYACLNAILSDLPKYRDASEIQTEATSLAEEVKAEAISAVIDRRDVPNRDTPIQLAVKLRDANMVDMLLFAGADWTLQNEHGWNALQEAICSKQEGIAMLILQHSQPLAWAKWCRRLPRLIGTMNRMKDFYLEISFHFESSVVPFLSKIAPSDTYKVWKVGANLRADMTLAGFDGFKIQRSDQSVLFLGDGSEDGKVPRGSLCMVLHKSKEVVTVLDGAGAPASVEELKNEVAAMSKSNLLRPGIDVTQAILLPQMNWRRQEKTEMVGLWKAKVYDMNNVVVSVKSRRVPGTATEKENDNEAEGDDFRNILTEEEQRQLEAALKLDEPNENGDNGFTGGRHQDSCKLPAEDFNEIRNEINKKHAKKGWFGGWRKKENKNEKRSICESSPQSSLCVNEKVGDLLEESNPIEPGRHSMDVMAKDESRKARIHCKTPNESNHEREFKKGLRPVLWLSPNFPLQTEELFPLLDILANKVKAIRRLRDLLTTKLPSGTFPVKVAIPVVPTIKVIVTFTKFEELQSADEFKTPPSSPTSSSCHESPSPAHVSNSQSSSRFRWANSPSDRTRTVTNGSSHVMESQQDPFAIPEDYKWVTGEEKRKKMQQKHQSKIRTSEITR